MSADKEPPVILIPAESARLARLVAVEADLNDALDGLTAVMADIREGNGHDV